MSEDLNSGKFRLASPERVEIVGASLSAIIIGLGMLICQSATGEKYCGKRMDNNRCVRGPICLYLKFQVKCDGSHLTLVSIITLLPIYVLSIG